MAPLILVLCIASLLGILTYLFLREEKHIKRLEIQSEQIQTELSKSRAAELRLREEMAAMQTDLQQVSKDSVTHLMSWTVFEDRLNQCVKECDRYQLTLGVIFVDVDGFKIINEALGNEIGDALLQSLAVRLESCIRQVDLIGRYSKDTFAIVLTRLNKPETAAVVAQRILQAISQLFTVKDKELYITAGLGVALYPSDGQDMATLCSNAERAMRTAKLKGKNLYQFAQENILLNSRRELALTISLRRDFVPKEFSVYYQPIINVDDKSVLCMDAQVQWRHPEQGLIDAKELYVSAEKQGKLSVITDWLLQSACKQFIAWRSMGFGPAYISIHVSLKQLENSHFVYRASQLMQDMKFKPEWLVLVLEEGTATVAMEGLEKSFNMLEYLKVKLAIDNFGANTCSLLELKKVPVNFLKLHPQFVSDIDSNQQTQALVKSMTVLAENIGVQLIAQGVASPTQVEILRSLNCVFMQGELLTVDVPEQQKTPSPA